MSFLYRRSHKRSCAYVREFELRSFTAWPLRAAAVHRDRSELPNSGADITSEEPTGGLGITWYTMIGMALTCAYRVSDFCMTDLGSCRMSSWQLTHHRQGFMHASTTT